VKRQRGSKAGDECFQVVHVRSFRDGLSWN
jgi:hypothetical protein